METSLIYNIQTLKIRLCQQVSPIHLYHCIFNIIYSANIIILEIVLTSVTISAIYMKLRDVYVYDSSVHMLLTYWEHVGLSKVLMQAVKKYTDCLWQRQQGESLYF